MPGYSTIFTRMALAQTPIGRGVLLVHAEEYADLA